jgi:hypothetical protein
MTRFKPTVLVVGGVVGALAAGALYTAGWALAAEPDHGVGQMVVQVGGAETDWRCLVDALEANPQFVVGSLLGFELAPLPDQDEQGWGDFEVRTPLGATVVELAERAIVKQAWLETRSLSVGCTLATLHGPLTE